MIRRRKGPKDWSPRGDAHWEPVWPEFVDSYLNAALWASMDHDGHSMDENFNVDDFSNEAVDQAVKECDDFVRENKADLESVGTRPQHAYDFWMTRNHHGVGFWDRGYGAVGDRLTDAAEACGESVVYAGDDKLLYFE